MIELKEKILPDGKKLIYFEERKIELPKELGWVIVVNKLIERGFKLKFYYTIEGNKKETYKLLYWDYDPEMKGMVPVVPDKIEVFKEVENPIIGKQEQLVGVIMDKKSRLDPDPEQTIMLWDMINI